MKWTTLEERQEQKRARNMALAWRRIPLRMLYYSVSVVAVAAFCVLFGREKSMRERAHIAARAVRHFFRQDLDALKKMKSEEDATKSAAV
jgi:hypothetical protein